MKTSPCSPQLEKSWRSNKDSTQPKINKFFKLFFNGRGNLQNPNEETGLQLLALTSQGHIAQQSKSQDLNLKFPNLMILTLCDTASKRQLPFPG